MREAIGSAIGRLGDPPRHEPLDHHRLSLVDRLVEAGADSAPAAWVDAWRVTAAGIDAQVQQEVVEEIRTAAAESRYPAKLIGSRMPNQDARESLTNRLTAAGIPLEKLDLHAPLAARAAAAAAAWDDGMVIARRELRIWRGVADEVAAWQRPWWPLAAILAALWLLVLVPAAWIGGLLPAPGWWASVSEWFWSLPWP